MKNISVSTRVWLALSTSFPWPGFFGLVHFKVNCSSKEGWSMMKSGEEVLPLLKGCVFFSFLLFLSSRI